MELKSHKQSTKSNIDELTRLIDKYLKTGKKFLTQFFNEKK